MSGPSSSDYQKQSDIQQQQIDLAKESRATSEADKAKMDALLKPAIDFSTAVTKDPGSMMTAMAPQIGELAKAGKTTEEQIYEQIPAGPARDMAIAENRRSTNTGIATAKNTTYTGALDKLANIGSGLGSFSLQELGAALSGFSGGASTGQSIISNKANTKAATTGMIGEFAGAAGTAAGGMKFCWIAEALYGADDPRTHLVRAWLSGPFLEKPLGPMVISVYRRYGQSIAAFARRHRSARAVLRPLFDAALRRANG